MSTPRLGTFCNLAVVAPLALGLFFAASQCAIAQKALPREAQDNIRKAIEGAPKNSMLFFNPKGEHTHSLELSRNKTEGHNSLLDLLRSPDSPAKSCKDPTPTPPPPCVICSTGEVVCSKASFKGQASSRSEPESKSASKLSQNPALTESLR